MEHKDTIESWGIGTATLETIVKCIKKRVMLRNVHYTSDLMYNLISISHAGRTGLEWGPKLSIVVHSRRLWRYNTSSLGISRLLGTKRRMNYMKLLWVLVMMRHIWQLDDATLTCIHAWDTAAINRESVYTTFTWNRWESYWLESLKMWRWKWTRAPRRVKNVTELWILAPIECVCTDLVRPMKFQSLEKSGYFVTLMDE